MNSNEVLRSAGAFLAAGLCEIGGGYLVWLWLREGRPAWVGALGGATLVLYGIVATFQPVHFGRAYAAYGGIFIALSLLWGWRVDRVTPDRYDLWGGALVVVGALVIMFWPRPVPLP